VGFLEQLIGIASRGLPGGDHDPRELAREQRIAVANVLVLKIGEISAERAEAAHRIGALHLVHAPRRGRALRCRALHRDEPDMQLDAEVGFDLVATSPNVFAPRYVALYGPELPSVDVV